MRRLCDVTLCAGLFDDFLRLTGFFLNFVCSGGLRKSKASCLVWTLGLVVVEIVVGLAMKLFCRIGLGDKVLSLKSW